VEEHSSYEEQLKQQQAAAKAAILAQCDRLATAGITFVAAHFDGSGDDGVTENVKCYDSDVYAYEECEQATHDASDLQEHFEELVPYGYENDAGGFGDVVLDVRKRKIIVERNDRFEDCSTTTYEV
jgi:hypothetical protein